MLVPIVSTSKADAETTQKIDVLKNRLHDAVGHDVVEDQIINATIEYVSLLVVAMNVAKNPGKGGFLNTPEESISIDDMCFEMLDRVIELLERSKANGR